MIVTKRTEKKKRGTLSQSFNRYSKQIADTVLRGIKMSGVNIKDPYVRPLDLVEIFKAEGPQSLVWKPETLCAVLDRKYAGADPDEVASSLVHFHETGELRTSIPPLVRHKLYAIRTILTSDTAHHEWHIFEKVGSAFNDRLADFSVVEPMSPIECAITVSIMDRIRPDVFSNEIAAYVAASCHTDGIYTLEPCKWLKFAEIQLRRMNETSTRRPFSEDVKKEIEQKLSVVQKDDYVLNENFSDIQALKLLALNVAGDNV